MIKKMFYSTLNDTFYEKRKDAEKAEDKYVEQYFKNLDDRAAAKRRVMNQFLTNPVVSTKIVID